MNKEWIPVFTGMTKHYLFNEKTTKTSDYNLTCLKATKNEIQ